jgi:hypothetical protein
MTQATQRFVVHQQAAKPKQNRSYTHKTFRDGYSLKGSNCLRRQVQGHPITPFYLTMQRYLEKSLGVAADTLCEVLVAEEATGEGVRVDAHDGPGKANDDLKTANQNSRAGKSALDVEDGVPAEWTHRA